jgi:hypothetical protein
MDGVEQLHGLGGLVRLQTADSMEAQVGMTRKQRRPFGERFLNPILAEIALPSGNQHLDLLIRSAFADSDQLDLGRIALCERGRLGDSVEDLLASIGGGRHAEAL